jgi:hypothetical protein
LSLKNQGSNASIINNGYNIKVAIIGTRVICPQGNKHGFHMMFLNQILSVKNNLFFKYLQIFKLHELVTTLNNQTQLLANICRMSTDKFWLA